MTSIQRRGRRTPMAEDWDFYMSPVENRPAAFFVDLSLAESAPDRARPWLLRVAVTMKAPRDDGLSDPAETDNLYAIEDELFSRVARGLRARYVGRVTGQARREHFYYGATAEGFADAVGGAMGRFPDYEFSFRDQHDPEWRVYFDFLSPGPLEQKSIETRRLVEDLANRGDDLTRPRDVDHWLFFPSEHSREEFLKQVRSEGFRIETFTAREPRAEYPCGLHLARYDRVDLESIDGLASDLFLRAQRAGGEYDGWGTAVVRE